MVYVVSETNSKAIVWIEGDSTPTNTLTGVLSQPTTIFATVTGDVYMDSRVPYGSIIRWSPVTNTSVPVMNASVQCLGLFVDTNNTLYCSLRDCDKVIKQSLDSNSSNVSTLAAGTDQGGSASNQLSKPYGIFVDRNFILYVADCNNNRIQRFERGNSNATTVPVTVASPSSALSCPTGVIFDADGYLFIVDTGNNRIVGSGPNGFRCVAACGGGVSSALDHFSYPRSLSFDSYGNIFVTDTSNDRIQKFRLTNNSCSKHTIWLLSSNTLLEDSHSHRVTS